MVMASEKTPLIQTTVYFLERQNSNASSSTHRRVHSNASSSLNPNNNNAIAQDSEEIETIPEGSTVGDFNPRPLTGGNRSITSKYSRGTSSSRGHRGGGGGGWLHFFQNVVSKKKSHAHDGGGGGSGSGSQQLSRSAPVKIDPKVFFANERTFLAWMHVSVILAGASVAIVAFADAPSSSSSSSTRHGRSLADQLYGVVLLPVSIVFILYAMLQYSRRSSMIRRKSPGPYVDIVGPTVLTVILMLSIVTQFSLKLYTLM